MSNPYSFNITENISFNATCTSKSTNITITVGAFCFSMPGNLRINNYGYSDNELIYNGPRSFGKCSPSIYKGATITGVMVFFREINNIIDDHIIPPRFSIIFSQHVSISKIIINNTIFDATNIKHTDSNSGCSYDYKINANDDNAWLVKYFHDNYENQITITLE